MRAATGFEPSDKWFGQQAVYRVSMGNFLFFASMSLALLGVKYKGDKRGQVLQHGNWMIKLVVWVLFMALPFLFPNGLVQAYGKQMPGGLGGGVAAALYASDQALHPVSHASVQALAGSRGTMYSIDSRSWLVSFSQVSADGSWKDTCLLPWQVWGP
jgi:hypothetical protein